MPVEVPESPKVFTTVYDNFRGVDFTNDASNVWKHRSPNGLNMLPDLDGRPYKRTGWKIDKSAEDFLSVALPVLSDIVTTVQGVVDALQTEIDALQYKVDHGTATAEETAQLANDIDEMAVQTKKLTKFTALASSTSVTPYKVYYFEIGGIDYLFIFNSLGVFYYNGDELSYISEYVTEDNSVNTFPVTPESLFTDAKKGFFFESQGTAGFYFIHASTLFRFQEDTVIEDGEETSAMRLHAVEPYIPTVYIACDPATGAGVYSEAINMLTHWTKASYTCNKSNTVTKYMLPSRIYDSEGRTPYPPVVEYLRDDGEWHTLVQRVDYLVPTTFDSITFQWTESGVTKGMGAPTEGVAGEDNIRITYVRNTSVNSGTTILSKQTSTLARNDDSTWGYWNTAHAIAGVVVPYQSGSGYQMMGETTSTPSVSSSSSFNHHMNDQIRLTANTQGICIQVPTSCVKRPRTRDARSIGTRRRKPNRRFSTGSP